MKLRLPGFPTHLMALAALLTLALALSIEGATYATAASTSNTGAALSISCLSVTPVIQQVAVNHPAQVTILVRYPSGFPSVITVTWGDGSISGYRTCSEICPGPIIATHVYVVKGTYHPVFCLVPPPSEGTSDCTKVEIIVR